jgi:hypothetical protein
MNADLLVAEQIAQLFHGHRGVVWELVATRGPKRSDDVAIQDAHGAPVAYARPAE